MPASAYSASVAWGVYFAASIVLLAACYPALSGVRSLAFEDSAAETAGGFSGVINTLRPGVVVSLSFQSPAPGGMVMLSGHSLTVAWGGASATEETVWRLPNETLLSGAGYKLELKGGVVEVLDDV